jgi:hypothetical protein
MVPEAKNTQSMMRGTLQRLFAGGGRGLVSRPNIHL